MSPVTAVEVDHLKKLIREVPNFPKKGILFYDITTLLKDKTGLAMKALKGSAEEKALVERYVRQLNEQEDRMQSLRREISEMQQKRDSAQSTLNGMVEALQMEVTL